MENPENENILYKFKTLFSTYPLTFFEIGDSIVFSFSEFISTYFVPPSSEAYKDIQNNYSIKYSTSDVFIDLLNFPTLIFFLNFHPLHYEIQSLVSNKVSLDFFHKPTEIYCLHRLWKHFQNKGFFLYYQYPVFDRTYFVDTIISINGTLIGVEVNENSHFDRSPTYSENRTNNLSIYFNKIFEINVQRYNKKLSLKSFDVQIDKVINQIEDEIDLILQIYSEKIDVSNLISESIESIYFNMVEKAIGSNKEFPITLDDAMKFLGITTRKEALRTLRGRYKIRYLKRQSEFTSEEFDETLFVSRFNFGVEYVEITEKSMILWLNDYENIDLNKKTLLYIFEKEVVQLYKHNSFDVNFDSFGFLSIRGGTPL